MTQPPRPPADTRNQKTSGHVNFGEQQTEHHPRRHPRPHQAGARTSFANSRPPTKTTGMLITIASISAFNPPNAPSPADTTTHPFLHHAQDALGLIQRDDPDLLVRADVPHRASDRTRNRPLRQIDRRVNVTRPGPFPADRLQPARCLDRQLHLDRHDPTRRREEHQIGPVKRRTAAGPDQPDRTHRVGPAAPGLINWSTATISSL